MIRGYGGRKDPRIVSSKVFIEFFLGDKTIDIKDIETIRIKYGGVFGLFHIIMLLYIVLLFGYCIYNVCYMFDIYDLEFNSLYFILFLPSLLLIMLTIFLPIDNICDIFKYKAIQINIKNEKSICIPIESWIQMKDKSVLSDFLKILKNINPEIKIKNSIDFGRNVIILIILAYLGFRCSFAFIQLAKK